MNLKGFRQPKKGLWRIDFAQFQSLVPDTPRLSIPWKAIGLALVGVIMGRLLHIDWSALSFPLFGMAILPYYQANEAAIGANHPTWTDSINRPLREFLRNAGLNPDSTNISVPSFSQTVNAGSNAFSGTKEARITAAVALAVSLGWTMVYIPIKAWDGLSMLPYNASLVTFNTAVQMRREGGSAFVEVKAYGAAGNNSQDDTVACNAAAAGASGDILSFTADGTSSTYKITAKLSIPSNCTVIMENGAKVVQYTEAASCFEAASVTNVKFRDCTVDYNTTAVRQTTGAIHVVSSTNFEIIGCRVIKAAGMGFYTANNVRGRILSNIVESTLADGIHVTNGSSAGQFSKDISIVNNICNLTGDDSISVIGYTAGSPLINETITITGNVVDNCSTRAITVSGGKFVVISSNTVRGMTAAGTAGINVLLDESFATFAPEEVLVVGNTIQPGTGAAASNRHGIRVYRAPRCTVIGNIVDWQVGEGIMAYGKTDDTDDLLDCVIANNIVRGTTTGEQGIHAQRANRCQIKGNTIINSCKSGIYAEICDDVLIDGNILDESNLINAGGTNLLSIVGGGVNAVVTGNVVRQTGTNFTHAIIFSSQTGEARHANNIFLITSTMAGVRINSTSSNVNPAMSADRGDASVTLEAGKDAETQRFATVLTVNRTVTLSTTSANCPGLHHGAKFRVSRSGLGAFTLDVGGLKTIPISTAAFVDVEWDAGSAAWRLAAYGTL